MTEEGRSLIRISVSVIAPNARSPWGTEKQAFFAGTIAMLCAWGSAETRRRHTHPTRATCPESSLSATPTVHVLRPHAFTHARASSPAPARRSHAKLALRSHREHSAKEDFPASATVVCSSAAVSSSCGRSSPGALSEATGRAQLPSTTIEDIHCKGTFFTAPRGTTASTAGRPRI